MAGPAREGQFNLDGILSELGSFGKYQLLLLLLLSFRDSFLSMCNYHFVFTAADVGSRCYVPECESFADARYNTSWLQYTVGNNSALCRRLAPIHHVTLAGNSSQANDSSVALQWGERCVPEMFDEPRTVACDKIVYDDYNSIVAEFDLACQPWKRTLIGTVHNLGLIFSYILSGLVSDKYGRKVVIVGTPLVVGVAGLLKSFSVNYWMLIVLEFMETAFGYGTASIVMSLEAVNQNNRVVFSCLSDLLSSFGSAFFSLIAWKVPYWRNMMRAIYAPLLVVLFYIFLMDEGVRWLLAHNKNNEAVRILNKVAKVNGVTLSNSAKEMLTTISEERSKADKKDEPKKQDSHNIIQALKSKTILLRVALISGCSVCSTFVFTGAIINSTNISGNPYLNLAAMQLVSIPTRVVSALTLTRFGRKAPLCIAYCFCACCFVASALIPKSHGWASTMLYVAGKMGSSYGTFGLFVVAMESFPTTSRNSLVNIVSTLGRLGSVLAPQAPLLSQYMHGLPSVVFGLAALGACLLSLLLPDTSQAALPEDVAQAENIDRTDQKEKQETA